MTQVNFYTLSSDAPEARLHFACRLTEKARELGHRIFIHTDSLAQAKQLDELLWQFRPTSFIPHALLADAGLAATADVCISPHPAPPTCSDVLINLNSAACANPGQFTRINEIVAADADSIEAGRDRYRTYRDAGVTLETFKI